jgi:hypothetical protein
MSVRHFNTTRILDVTGRWIASIPNNINAKTAVIRQITYVSTNATKALYNITCSLSPNAIGSVCNSTAGFVSNPQSRIHLANPNVSYIEFVVTSPMLPIQSVALDMISIDIDFE